MNLYERIANAVPELQRGKVWCTTCGAMLRVDSAECLRSGWPKCCEQTMTIDSPQKRAAFRRAEQAREPGGDMTDTELLDWMEEQHRLSSYTGKCVWRWSTSGRGWRLHETSGYDAKPTVREAIQAAIERARAQETT